MARTKGTRMKETRNGMMQQKDTPKRSVWKVLAIIFIALFAAILVAGFLWIDRVRPAHVQATQEQMDTARAAAVADLTKRGEDLAALTITVSDAIRHPRNPQGTLSSADKSIIGVSAYGKSIGHSYLIDATTGAVLLYTKTEFIDTIDHKNDAKRRQDGRFPPR